ncbi:class III lanthipeptide [Streptomyces sp. NPDC013178]
MSSVLKLQTIEPRTVQSRSAAVWSTTSSQSGCCNHQP